MNILNNGTKTEREEFLDSVITTALEGGIGYWSMATEYKWSDEGPTTARIFVTEGEEIICSICEQPLLDARTTMEAFYRHPVMFLTESELEGYEERRAAVEESGETEFVFMVEHEREPKTLLIDRALIEKAFATMLAGPVNFMSDKWRAHLIGASAINEAGDIDAGDADAIVQVGLFGEVVYG